MPALLGLPVLARFLTFLITLFFGYIIRFLHRFITKGGIQLTLFLSGLILLNSVLLGYISDLSQSFPPELIKGYQLCVPENAYPCAIAILSCRAAIFIFDMKNKILSYLEAK